MSANGTAAVVRVDESHLEALAAFIARVWDRGATAEGVSSSRRAAAVANPVRPGEAPPAWLFLAEDRAVGHVGTLPLRLWTGGEDHPAHWVKGLMVLPEHRNGPVGFLVLREAVRELECALAMVVQPEARRLFQALGFTDLGVVPDALRILRPTEILRRLDPGILGEGRLSPRQSAVLRVLRGAAASAFAGGVFSGAGALWRLGSRARRGRGLFLPEVGEREVDRLWTEFRVEVAAAPVRNARYLRTRYTPTREVGYRLVGVRDAGRLLGLGVVRPPRAEGDPRLNGIRIAVLSEVVVPPSRPEVGLAVLAAAEEVAQALEADALLCGATHPFLRGLLRRRAFLPLPGNVHFLLKPPPGTSSPPPALDAWWLTRGDSFADEVF